MGAEERPQKMRKVDHSEDAQPEGNLEVGHEVSDSATNGTAVAEATHEPGRNEMPLPSDTAPMVETNPAQKDLGGMSKNQLKKLRKKADWEAGREERKSIRKEKTTAKRERKKVAKREEIAAAAARGVDAEALAKEKRQALQRPVQLPVTIVLDCNFDDLMRDNERISLGAQITRCYSDNKNSKFRAHLTVSSFGGQLKERYETVLMGVYKSWKGMRFLEEDFVETADKAKEWMSAKEGGELKGAFSEQDAMEQAGKDQLKQQGEVVYLSSESDETLTELKPYSTYIIGGLVDKNREKGICHKRATQRGVRTAKLPIGKYLEMSSRKVLATNHVNEIMIKWLECRDWGEAFMHVIPKRKGGKLLGSYEETAGESRGDKEALDEADAADEAQEVTEREAVQAEVQDGLADEHASSKDPST